MGVDVSTVVAELDCEPSEAVGPDEIFHRVVADVGEAIAVAVDRHHALEWEGIEFFGSDGFGNRDVGLLDEVVDAEARDFVGLGGHAAVGYQGEPISAVDQLREGLVGAVGESYFGDVFLV